MKLNPSGPRKASPSLRGSALDPLKDRDQMAALRVDMRRRNRRCAMTAIGAEQKLDSHVGSFRFAIRKRTSGVCSRNSQIRRY